MSKALFQPTALKITNETRQSSQRYAFAPMSLVEIDGILFVPVASDEHAHVMTRADAPDLVESFTHARLADYQKRGLLIERAGALSTTSALLAASRPCERLVDLPKARVDAVLFRKQICDAILRALEHGETSLSDKALSKTISDAWLQYAEDARRRTSPDGRCGKSTTIPNPPSPTTVRRWMKILKAAAYDPMALCPSYGRSGNRLSRFEPEEQVLLHRFASRYASLRKPTKVSIWREMKAIVDRLNRMRGHAGLRPLVCPGRMALSHAIDQLDQFAVYAGREGADAAKRRFAITARGLEVERPLERVEADEWKLPLQVILTNAGLWKQLNRLQRKAVETTRLWLSTVIDVRTKVVLAMRLSRTCTAANAVSTLRMAVSDKTAYAQAAGCKSHWDQCGIFETLGVDAGSAFRSGEYRAAVLDLGAEYLNPQAGMPRMRGTQERLYRTLHGQFIAMFDGRSFMNVVEKGDYDSEANATLDLELIAKLIVRFVVDIYHNTPHRGLNGQTPRNAWIDLRGRYGVRPPPSKAQAAAIFGTVVERRITNSGVAFCGLHYQSLPLQRIRGGRIRYDVKIRVDPSDLGWVWAFDGSVWQRIPCMRQGMVGVSLEQWLLAAATARRRYADEAATSEPVVLEALRDVRAAAEGARRRAGIASPVLSDADYRRIEKHFFSGFDRADADAIDILAERSLPVDTKMIDHDPAPPERLAVLPPNSVDVRAADSSEHAKDDDLIAASFVLERDVEPDEEPDEDDFETKFTLED